MDFIFTQFLALLKFDDISTMQARHHFKSDSSSLLAIVNRLKKNNLLIKQRTDEIERVARFYPTDLVIQLKSSLDEVKNKLVSYADSTSNEFFELLDRLKQHAKSFSKKEASKPVASQCGVNG